MRSTVGIVAFLLAYTFSDGQCYLPEDVPNTKLRDNSYVSNPDKILSENSIAELNALLSQLESETSVQIAVVVVNSICHDDVFDFAQRLFEEWGIGQASTDNGALVLLVLESRTVRIHTGYGIEGVLTDAKCKQFEREAIPHFRGGNNDLGILSITKDIAELFDAGTKLESPGDQEYIGDDRPPVSIAFYLVGFFALSLIYNQRNQNRRFSKGKLQLLYDRKLSTSKTGWIITYAVIPATIPVYCTFYHFENEAVYTTAFLYFYYLVAALYFWVRFELVSMTMKNNPDELTQFYYKLGNRSLFTALVYPLPFLFFHFRFLNKRIGYRNSARDCHKCFYPSEKLGKTEAARSLNPNQLFEDKLGVIDYDVWRCTKCSATSVSAYIKNSRRYSLCPECSTKALSKRLHLLTLNPATIYECKFCGYHNIEVATGDGSRGGFGSSSGRSSGGGGSWGGGRSGGGGSSSSW